MLSLLFTLLTLANASPETTTSLISLAVSLSTSSPSKLDYAGGLLHNAYQLIPADNNASHLAAFNDARSTLLSLRNDTFTSTIDFSTSSSEALTSEQDVKPLPFFVPYYICTSTTIPFFFYDFDCDGSNSIPNGEVLPVVKTIMVKPRRRKDDGKWVFHFGEGDVEVGVDLFTPVADERAELGDGDAGFVELVGDFFEFLLREFVDVGSVDATGGDLGPADFFGGFDLGDEVLGRFVGESGEIHMGDLSAKS